MLVLDEPSTGLDAEARERLLEPLRGPMRATTIVVSHDLLTRATPTGSRSSITGVVELGSHDELLDAGGVYARLWELHASRAFGRPRRRRRG